MGHLDAYILTSPLYQAIQAFSDQGIPSGAGDASYYEPFSLDDYVVIHFTKLMEAYRAEEADF